MTVTPETVDFYEESVRYLLDQGIRYLIVSLNYAGAWTDTHIKKLQSQYKALSKLYKKLTLDQKKFYFSPFEMKFISHIKEDDVLCRKCALGMKQISIAPDGRIYPCVQFVKDGVSNTEYSIGNVTTGIDEDKRHEMYMKSIKKYDICQSCDYSERCTNDCSCLNWQATGYLNEVSPVLCETERILLPVVDKLGEDLYRRRAPMFIQKHYNAIYPILSLLDDREQQDI